MAFQLSPGVNVTEIDLTTVVPAVATSDGAFAGVFRWGPVGERVFVDSENNLVKRFGKPSNLNAETFFTAANFLSYANRLYISRAANTTGVTPVVSANIAGVNTSILLTSTNISDVAVGMYVTQVADVNGVANVGFYTNGTKVANINTVTVVSKNSSHIVLSKPLSIATSNSTTLANGFSIYFGNPATAYNAVGFDPASSNAYVANLVNQIVKNEDAYTDQDGTFDADIIYVAKYPGDLGNSLRVSVCDESDSFSSNIALSNSSVNTAIEFRIGSNTATVKFTGSTNASANAVKNQFAVGDQILAGNSSIGVQYLQVKTSSVAGNSTANVTVNGNSAINSNINFITVTTNPFTNGDVVVYSNTGSNSVLLANGTALSGTYHIVEANSSGFKLSSNAFGSALNIVQSSNTANIVFLANVNVLSIQFEDPYRLREEFTDTTIQRYWEFFNVVDTAPGQSDYVLYNGNTSAHDEVHVIVVDDDGGFTGVPGTILEVYKGLSRATDAKTADGINNYYKDVINQNSQYIWWTNDRSVAVSNTAAFITDSSATAPANITLTLGADGHSEANATLGILGNAYDLFAAAEAIDISLVLQGKPIGGTTVSADGRTVNGFLLANYIIDNIVGGSSFDPQNPNGRRDCVAFISPALETVLNNTGEEALDMKAWRNAVHSSSYAVMDSGYKYQYDRYNNVYRWIPLNGDIAGTCVRTDATNDAWWSPAGFNRGQIKNLVKLAWNPNKAERDLIYPVGVNPVVTFPGQGTVLYGDKTLQSKPSAFDRINVRRLFIVLEKAISTAAKYSLFEFNDAFTRAQFKNLVIPYLRTIKGRRGITDFLVVCDDTNNTAQVIDSNQFVGDIYIKPARSINFIQLNFVAVPSGVQFSEVVGKF